MRVGRHAMRPSGDNFILSYIKFNENPLIHSVAQWLRCCATNRKVAGSIPAGVSGFFIDKKILPIALWPRGRLYL